MAVVLVGPGRGVSGVYDSAREIVLHDVGVARRVHAVIS